MIESAVVFLFLLLGGGLFLAARLSRQKERSNPAVEKQRLRESLAWHEARLRRARASRWDEQMMAGIHSQLQEVQARIAELGAEEEAAARGPLAQVSARAEK